MTGFGVVDVFVGALQLIVPSYALRLVRRFGAHRVGWFVVTAFLTLAVLYSMAPLTSRGSISGVAPQLIYLFASALLLIGMGHLDSLFAARLRACKEEKALQARWQAYVDERTKELSRANEHLLKELAHREESEQILKDSATQYRALFLENPQPMWVFDLRSLRFLAVNEAALKLYEFSPQEFMALTAKDLVSPAQLGPFLHEVARPCLGPQTRGLWQHLRGDATYVEVESTSLDIRYSGCPARLVLVNETAPGKRREKRLCQEQKMEVTRQIAGGVAHHLNNLLTIIDGHTNLMLLGQPDARTGEKLKQVSIAANRAAGITRQLLAVSGQFPLHLEPLELNEFLRKSEPMLRRLVGSQVKLEMVLGNRLPLILGDSRRVEPMLVNLVLNARDAMRNGGTLTIATSAVRIGENQARHHDEARPGEFVRLVVRDTGCGMTPEVQAHLFEPFFTTHDVGQGVGLGLASVYGVVKQHAGWVDVQSEVGAGTEFKTFFPCAPADAKPAQNEPSRSQTAGGGTILLVEPNDRIRGLARYVLGRQGYKVVEADCGGTVMNLLEGNFPNVDLLLAEIKLPGEISGIQLAEWLQPRMPKLKVAFTAENGEEFQPDWIPEGAKFISKPYTPDKLLQAINACL